MTGYTKEQLEWTKPTKVIGIIGGMGPFAHIDFERKVLEASKRRFGAMRDQQYPAWLVSCLPETPDRTMALRGDGEDPTPWLVESARRITGEGRADFLVMCCHTAHAFVRRLQEQVDVPVLDMVEQTCEAIAEAGIERAGILGTTGLLTAGLYQRALESRGVQVVTPLDLAGGEKWQKIHVMESIYGDPSRPEDDGGIKGGGEAIERAKDRLTTVSGRLVYDLKAQAIVAACTEIPLALTGSKIAGMPLIDPTMVLAEAAVEVAHGARELSSRAR